MLCHGHVMTDPHFLLRRRILGSLAASTLAVVACKGETTPETPPGPTPPANTSSSSGNSSSSSGSTDAPDSGAVTPTCTNGKPARSCWAPDSIITKSSGYGGGPPDPDAAPPPPPTRDANGCVVMDEVMNGCCNPAVTAAVLEDGKCCYEFCEGACCGRPLVVEGLARIAPVAVGRDWLAGIPACADLDAQTRSALRDAWTRDALLEHASIASFATFTLELLAVGAPPQLLQASQAAAADEIEHAGLTFAIASAYSDVPLGPGRLDLTGLAPASDLATIAAACVRDGCVNETIASAVAAAQAAHARDPEVRATLERIAEDEARHAELAWRFVRWALGRGDVRVRGAVAEAFDRSIVDVSPKMPDGIDETTWNAHGRLTATEHARVVREVHDQVIGPCRQRLLERAGDQQIASA